MSIKQQIKDVIRLIDDPEWLAMGPFRKGQVLGAEIAEATGMVLRALDPDAIDTQLPEFISAAEELYDEYLVPIDIPNVPDRIEKWAENIGRGMIKPGILMYVESLSK